jgi:hypothetical protein
VHPARNKTPWRDLINRQPQGVGNDAARVLGARIEIEDIIARVSDLERAAGSTKRSRKRSAILTWPSKGFYPARPHTPARRKHGRRWKPAVDNNVAVGSTQDHQIPQSAIGGLGGAQANVANKLGLVGAGRFERPTPCAQGSFRYPAEMVCFQALQFQKDGAHLLHLVEP